MPTTRQPKKPIKKKPTNGGATNGKKPAKGNGKKKPVKNPPKK